MVSGGLVGLDMTRIQGRDWVQKCQTFFEPEDRIYTNGVGERAGGSFWYELFPNILAYQLADLYPTWTVGQEHLREAADQWYRACVAMGGKTDPWTLPDFDHTAFRFATMTPVNNGKWMEPDAAAGIAWLELMAWTRHKDPRYLTAADWGLQALERRPVEQNPLYEVLLPYGALAAARMKAELGHDFDVGKLLHWCFEAGGRTAARWGWGVIADRFGEYECQGLAGSVIDTDGYAFTMNTFEWAGALTPIARYDSRYARALGRWMLNLTNAARLFYPNALPADHQDNRAWADRFDPASCLAYEGLRKKALDDDALRPYATGDAMRAGQPSNLCLYGSSHVGILGALVAPTNVEKILRLDLLKTDYFHAPAYPTYLYYNPYESPQTVEITTGSEPNDLYDAVGHRFLERNVHQTGAVTIQPDSALVVVIAPANGRVTQDGKKRLLNGVVVDYACE